jgi:hypothetical protein
MHSYQAKNPVYWDTLFLQCKTIQIWPHFMDVLWREESLLDFNNFFNFIPRFYGIPCFFHYICGKTFPYLASFDLLFNKRIPLVQVLTIILFVAYMFSSKLFLIKEYNLLETKWRKCPKNGSLSSLVVQKCHWQCCQLTFIVVENKNGFSPT